MVRRISGRLGRILAQEEGHRRRFAGVAHLLTGNFLASLLALAAFALSARALGLVEYGELALMLAFTRVVERVVSFQSWQPIIRYGAGLQKPEHHDDLRALLKFGFLLDLGAAVCAFVVALASACLLAPFFGWTPDFVRLLALYATVLLFQLSGVPTAVQRMAGNFHLLAYGQLFNAMLRVALSLAGLVAGAGLGYFVLVWAGTQILGSLTALALAVRTLRRQNVRGIAGASLKGLRRRFPGIWGFSWSANVSLTLRMSTQEVDTLLVGALADPASAGLYHIAKRIGRFGQQVGVQAQAVLYPDFVRIWSAGRSAEVKRVVLHTEAFLLALGMLGLVFLFFTVDPLLRWTAGPEFLGAANLVLVQMIAAILVISGSAARAALLGMGHQREVLRIVMVSVAVFHVTAILLIPEIGAMGGSIAHIVMGVIVAVGLALALRRALGTQGTVSSPSAALAAEGI